MVMWEMAVSSVWVLYGQLWTSLAPSMDQLLHPHGETCWEQCCTCLGDPWAPGKACISSLVVQTNLWDLLCRAAQNSQKYKTYFASCLCVVQALWWRSGQLNWDLEVPPWGLQPPCWFIKKRKKNSELDNEEWDNKYFTFSLQRIVIYWTFKAFN